jgi:hypothetical protein
MGRSGIITSMPLRRCTSRTRRARRLLIAAAFAVLGACNERGPATRSASGPAILVKDDASARASIGKRVRVRGVAQNGKLAALVAGDVLVYCLDRDSWPGELEGRMIEAEGVLEVTDQFAATEGPGGEISQGTRGADLVLRHASIRVVDR